jgi:hypothetical protein
MADNRITIHDGVPLPKKQHHPIYKYPFNDLQEGSMFLVECPVADMGRVMRSVTVAAHGWCKRRGMPNVFTCRTMPDGSGVGIFRLRDEGSKEKP